MSLSKRSFLLPLPALALIALGGCTDLKRALGMEKVVPDEFAVVRSAPLAMPPDFSLRPPKPGAPPSQEVSPTAQARQTIFRATDQQQAAAVPDADKLSPGENALLREAGASSAAPDIRDTVNREALQATAAPVDESFVDKLLFWRTPDKSAGAAASVIDPAEEAQRLKGGPATASDATAPSGATPAAASAPSAAPKAAPELLGPPTIERRHDPSTG